ncbi:MAG: hypothetical protein M1595_00485 [Candidatus Thermoplasmatota archaeon]|nr:hypothetical protein [Candidatus Thermoplasmatota archaeon]
MTDEEKKTVNVDTKGIMTMVMPMVQKYTAMLEDIRKELEWQRKALIQIHEELEKK